MMATVLFFAVTFVLVLAWNRLFGRVPWRAVLGIWLAISLYQGETLFTNKIDVPARFAYHVYPWKALGREPVNVNTGLVLREMVAWTETAREIVKSGEAPLFNRRLGAGTPLLSDQQSSIVHPFTLLGLFLPIGKAWTLSVALRLFFALFFLFVFLRNWGFRDEAAFFGAIAYGFSTFHLVTLLMPLGLTIMMLPMALATTDELMRRPRARSYLAVAGALVCTLLAGHPESELWVGLATGAYALYMALALRKSRSLVLASAAALTAVLLTAFFWYPTAVLLKSSNRYRLMSALLAHPLQHHLGAPWFTVLVSPNILGTVPTGSYRPPEPRAADLLDDYGEVVCGYTGIATLALAVAALPLAWRRKPGMFALGLIAVGVLMFAETPGWHALVLKIPLVNVSQLQRFRVFWNLGIVILGVIALDAWLRGELGARRIVLASVFVLATLGLVWIIGLPVVLPRMTRFELLQVLAPGALLIALPFLTRFRRFAIIVTALTFCELVFTTWRNNPPSSPSDLFPVTGAVAALDDHPQPYRVVARGTAFLPDTLGFYGLEDVKTTSPFSSFEYLRLFNGYFHAEGFDELVGTTHYPFTDFLNVRYIYVEPGQSPGRDDVREVYRGPDGAVFVNDKALPRYFLPAHFDVELDYGNVVARMTKVADYRRQAFVDHIPSKVQRLAPVLSRDGGGGEVRVVQYGPSSVDLSVDSRGWNLLASSDTFWPGWRVYWNGERMPPVRVNGAFLGVFVPPGHGTVRFLYRPREFDQGLVTAGATLLVVIAAMCIHVGLRKRRNASPPESAYVS